MLGFYSRFASRPRRVIVHRAEFESWRDFSQFAEHKIENAEDRDEKRWMEKQNANELKKRKKAEVNRIATLVDRARARDPRILKDKEDERSRKEEAKVRCD